MAVFVSVGQCGNQVAGAFWQHAQKEFGIGPGASAGGATDAAAVDKLLGRQKPSGRGKPGQARARATGAAAGAGAGSGSGPGSGSGAGVGAGAGGGADRHASGMANPLTDDHGWAASVMVDSEPKVLQAITRRGARSYVSCVRPQDMVYDQSGRGNLWAWGYNETASQLSRRAEEAIRRKVEAVDRFATLVMMHSTSGGTGSGLGSRVLEDARDTYPGCFVVSSTVLPFQRGETPLQNYNTVLSMWKLQELADAVMVFNNDALMERAAPQRGSKSRVSMSSMNKVAVQSMAQVMFPYYDDKACAADMRGRRRSTRTLRGFDGGEFSTSLCAGGVHKLVEAQTVPYRVGSAVTGEGVGGVAPWSKLGGLLSRVVPRFDESNRRVRMLSCRVIARGVEQPDLAAAAAGDGNADVRPSGSATRQRKRVYSTQWRLPGVDEWQKVSATLARDMCDSGPLPLYSSRIQYQLVPVVGTTTTRRLCACYNSTAAASHLRNVAYRARLKFEAGAYVHWYERHGCERDTLGEAIDSVDDIVCSYDAFA